MLRQCRVSVKDMNEVVHTVSVSASSLFEAVALGLAQIKKHEWVADIATGFNTVTVEPLETFVRHRVVMQDFQRWLDREGGKSPKEMAERQRIRAIIRRK